LRIYVGVFDYRSPDSALQSGLEKKLKFTPSGPQLWKGFIFMQDVAKFVTTAYRVAGPVDRLVRFNFTEEDLSLKSK